MEMPNSIKSEELNKILQKATEEGSNNNNATDNNSTNSNENLTQTNNSIQ